MPETREPPSGNGAAFREFGKVSGGLWFPARHEEADVWHDHRVGVIEVGVCGGGLLIELCFRCQC